MRVLAMDPGERVGWARVEMGPKGEFLEEPHYGISSLKDMALRLEAVYHTYDVVIYEDFAISESHCKELRGSRLPTVQFIGMVRLLGWRAPNTVLVKQYPKDKPTALKTMKKLRPELFEVVTEPIRHDDGHHQDALLHLHHYSWRLM